MQKDVLKEFEITFANLLETISQFNQTQYNTVPFEGSWTAGEVSEHIYKSIKGMPSLLQGEVKVTSRKADEKVPIIESIFLDFTTKMKSPDNIKPTEGDKQKDKLYSDLKSKGEGILGIASELDLRLLFTTYSIPGMGEFTGIEWLAFINAHTKRHTHQMKRILEKLTT